LFSAGSAIIKNGLVMFNKFTTAGLNFPAQGSAEFNGTSDIINIEPAPIGAESAMTISGWIYTSNALSGFKGMVSKGSPNGYEDFIVFGGNNGKLGFFISTNTGDSTNVYSTSNINGSVWKHFACQWDSSSNKMNIYIDGSLETTSTKTGDNISNDDNLLSLGAYSDTSQFLECNLANVAIWNRALSSDEINSVMWKSYEGLTDSEENGLQAWYSLDDITSPAASLANMEQLATDKDATIENKAAITAAINALS
jgi:hypothetical protein